MTRKKVKLVFISNDSARKLCSKKRRVGLLKKVSELTVLCGVDAFCIIYSLDESEPTIWPSSPVVHHLIVKYFNLPHAERCKKSLNQESYLMERIGKAQDMSMKNLKKNKDMDLRRYMQQLHQGRLLDYLSVDELSWFAWLVQEKMIDITKRMDYFDHTPPSTSFFTYHVGGGAHGMVNPRDIIQWNNYDLGTDRSTNHNDTRATFGSNMSTLIANNAINMGVANSFYEDIDPRATTIGSFNMGFPNLLVENFNVGGSNTNNGLQLPHESWTGNVDYGAKFEFLGQAQGFGNNIENVNNIGSWGIGGHHQVQPYNYVENGILSRNSHNQISLPNEYINLEFGNEIGIGSHTNSFAANTSENEWNNSTIGLGLSNNHIRGNINFGGGDIRNTLFGSTSDVQRLNTTITTINNNNLAS